MSIQCEVIIKLDSVISRINFYKFDFLFVNFVCVRIFLNANC